MADRSLSHVERLEVDRDRLEAAIRKAEPAQLARLVQEHRAVLKDIAALAKPQEGSTRDQLKARREARKASAAGSAASEVRQ